MKYTKRLSCLFLIAVIFFSWGFFAGEYNTIPGPKIEQIRDEVIAFVKGGQANQKSIAEKLSNDMGLRPERMLVNFQEENKRRYRNLEIYGLKKRRSFPLIFMNTEKAFPSGYILVWGAFDFETHLHGAILIDKDGAVVHTWVPDEDAFASEIKEYNKRTADNGKEIAYKPPQERFPHGLVVYKDGSIIFNDGDPGNGMQKIDFCSNALWVKLGEFNHVISKQESDSSIWAMDRDDILHKINPLNGESLKLIQVEELMRANPDVDILSIRRNYIDGEWFNERWHFNDIEPLPVDYKDAFPRFNPGDLLLSMRSLNAVMVLDPNSKKIKWWRVGAFSRQHDPDWQQDGTITVYDNQTRDKYGLGQPYNTTKFSRILRIHVNNYQSEVLYTGQNDNFYSSIRGKHQILPNGNILITSSNQGRVLIIDNKGETVFELLNKYDSSACLLISEAIWLPQDFYDFDFRGKDCLKMAYNKTEWHTRQNSSVHYTASKIELNDRILNLKPLPFETELSFKDNPFLVFDGWSYPEKAFRWTEGNAVRLHFCLPHNISEKAILIKFHLHTLGRQKIQVYCNDKFVSDFYVQADSAKIVPFNLPSSALKVSGVNTLRFVLPEARSPDSPDKRVLAIALHGIEFSLK